MSEVVKTRKKLIEVALPLEAINTASAREKSIRHGHPSTMHPWWARRPLAAARAVIFSQMVDDPSSHPELYSTEVAQDSERQRLFRIIEQLVLWENTTNERILADAREEIWKSWRMTCDDNRNHPKAKELFNPDKLPAFHDPFAGGGSLPLEAQRLGLEAYASDLNPVAVLINMAMIEIPPKFAGQPPVNPEIRKNRNLFQRKWHGTEGLAEDIRYYGQWMRDELEKRIGRFYPKVEITSEMAKERPDLKPLVGKKLTVIAWLWARTVKSPNPAFAKVDVPLASTFMLSTKPGKEAYVDPLVEGSGYKFRVKVGKPKNQETAKNGTKLARGANFRCVMSGVPMSQEHIRGEFQAKRNSERLMAIVAEGESTRVYLSPTLEQESVAESARPRWRPEQEMNQDTSNLLSGRGYGISHWHEIFTSRQLLALTTLSDLVLEMRELVERDALASGLPSVVKPLATGETVAHAYADALAVYLGLAVSKETVFLVTQARWRAGEGKSAPAFGRQALPMVWDYADINPFAGAGGDFVGIVNGIEKTLRNGPSQPQGHSIQLDAAKQTVSNDKIVSTDPPYYDNIDYADLSDYFYIWLRHSMKSLFPHLFATLVVPKAEELVATAYRHGGKEQAEAFFLNGMTQAIHRIAEQAHPAFPVTIYYAFRQSETEGAAGVYSTGWETFLDAVIRAGFELTGTWPMRTENQTRLVGMVTNALASSIILVCRTRLTTAPTATRREFLNALKAELPLALVHLQRSNIAPVDLAQAAIGPGMAVYTRYSSVLDASGKPLSVRQALAFINETLDEVLAEQEGDLDSESRWALAWFEQSGFLEGDYGVAETLSKAKNTSVGGLADANILKSKGGKVRLLRPEELPVNWDPGRGGRHNEWEVVHHLIKTLNEGGESEAARLVAKLGNRADKARELAYRLYAICERKKRPQEALAYNGLVQSWPEIARLAREGGAPRRRQSGLFEESEE